MGDENFDPKAYLAANQDTFDPKAYLAANATPKQPSFMSMAVPAGKAVLGATFGQIPALAKGVISGASFGSLGKEAPQPMEGSIMTNQGQAKSWLDKITPRKIGQVAGGIVALIGSDALAGIPTEALVAKYGLGAVQSAVAQGAITGATYEGIKGAMTNQSPFETVGQMAKTGAEFGTLGGIGEKVAEGVKAGSRQLEKTSGLTYNTPGVLEEAYRDPTLRSAPGVEKARQVYEEAKIGKDINPEFMKGGDFISNAIEKARNGTLDSLDALEARKALDNATEYIPYRQYFRDMLDKFAKQDFAGADEAYQRAVKADALRNIWAVNKSGSPSIVKGSVAFYKPWTIPFLSPYVQGLAASGLGRINQAIPTPLMEAIQRKGLVDSLNQ